MLHPSMLAPHPGFPPVSTPWVSWFPGLSAQHRALTRGTASAGLCVSVVAAGVLGCPGSSCWGTFLPAQQGLRERGSEARPDLNEVSLTHGMLDLSAPRAVLLIGPSWPSYRLIPEISGGLWL